MGLIYSRINNPNLEILENRLSLWDKADDCAVFESGMSAGLAYWTSFASDAGFDKGILSLDLGYAFKKEVLDKN